MKKDIRDMIRQKQVTGEKVGQAMIRDLVTLYQVQRDAQALDAQPLTESEKAQLVSALDSPEQVAIYSQYKFVIGYLQQVLLIHTSGWQDVEIHFLKLYSALSQLDDVEQLLGVIRRFPKLLDDAQAQQDIMDEQRRREATGLSGAQVLAGLCCWVLMRPGEPLHDSARRVMDGVYPNPDDPTAFIEHLRRREGAFLNALWQRAGELSTYLGESLDNRAPYGEVERVFPGLCELLLGTPGEACFPYGYAVPRQGAGPVDPMETEGIGVAALLDRLGRQLSQVYRGFLLACRHTLAVETAVVLLSQRIDVPELADFLPEANLADRLGQVRRMADRLPGLPQGGPVGEREELSRRVLTLFPPVELDSLRPSEKAKNAAKKAMSDLSILERPTVLHGILAGEGGGAGAS